MTVSLLNPLTRTRKSAGKYSVKSIWGSLRRGLLGVALAAAAAPALAVDPVSEIRVVTDLPDIVVGQVYGVEFEFYDGAGERITLEPNQNITIAPAGVFPCILPECSNAQYSEQVPTEAGRETYLLYVRSLVAGVNYLTFVHPNGTRLQYLLNAVDDVVMPPPADGPPTQFTILSQPSVLEPGQCAEIRVGFETDAGESAGLVQETDILLGPGGGFHPSADNCDTYQNDPIAVAAGATEFTFFGYVLPAYTGVGTVTLQAAPFADLRVSFSGDVPPPPPPGDLPTQLVILSQPSVLAPEQCGEIRIAFQTDAGLPAGLPEATGVFLSPGGGFHPSLDNCGSYQNDPVVVAAGATGFTFFGYVLPSYVGLGSVTLQSEPFADLQVSFIADAPPPPPPPPPSGLDIQVWANDGGDKVVREEIRSYTSPDVANSVWDGERISTFAARNEVVSFNVVVDNNGSDLTAVAVDFTSLSNGGYALTTTNTSAAALFDWNARPIEVFAVGYLKIHGLSRIAYELYDETHIPEELRRPFENFQPAAPAVGSGVWEDRQNHDKSYPDIAEPIEIRGSVPVAGGNSQSFWVDIYVPKNAPAGVLSGSLAVTVGGAVQKTVPVQVDVVDITLPDERVARTMVHIAGEQIAERYFLGAGGGVIADSDDTKYRRIVDNHFKLAWRHGLSLTDLNELVPDKVLPANQPNEDWARRLTGGLYTAVNGYAGPGQNQPHDVFSIGSYGNWSGWWGLRQYDPEATDVFDPDAPLSFLRSELERRTDSWETWFQTNAPDTVRYLYVDDEPAVSFINSGPRLPIEFANLVSEYVKENPGPGGNLDTFITASPLDYDDELPNINLLSTVISEGQTALWDEATAALNADPDRRYFMYNGRRPASGTFVTDDDGVALRELPWGQYKKGISRWFYWNSNYWNNFLGGPAVRDLTEVDPEGGQYRSGTRTNVFKSAHTFGSHDFFDPIIGEAGVFNYSNGDGVLMYPGTDRVFPAESRNIDGPIASLRMKHWRRGIQDVKYIQLAMEIDPAATQAIINTMVPEVMWELGVADENDPTYVHKPPSWSTDPDDWESARAQLVSIILGQE